MYVGWSADFSTSWRDSIWISWGLFFDPGTQTGISPAESWEVKMIALVFSICGFIFNLVFLGMIVQIIREVLERWHDDRSRISTSGHTLVLGWTDKTMFLLHEMFEEAQFMRPRNIVVLAERSESGMRQDIRNHFHEYSKDLSFRDNRRKMLKRLFVRNGCPFEIDDLMRVSASSARDIIVLSHGAAPRRADLVVTRVIVALASLHRELSGTVLAEVQVASTVRVIKRLLPQSGCLHAINARNVSNKILCLLAAQPLVGESFISLSSYSFGAEIYIVQIPELGGCTFEEACHWFKEAVCIGLKSAGGKIYLAPPRTRRIDANDHLLVISQDALKIGVMPRNRLRKLVHQIGTVSNEAINAGINEAINGGARFRKALNMFGLRSATIALTDDCEEGEVQNRAALVYVFVGWATDLPNILCNFKDLVPKGSKVIILSMVDVECRKLALSRIPLGGLQLEHVLGEMTNARCLAALPLATASAIIVLADSTSVSSDAYSDSSHVTYDTITSDSACLMAVLTIKDVIESTSELDDDAPMAHPRIICELLDSRTNKLLARNRYMQSLGVYFRSRALETGLFAMEMTDTTVWNALMTLLSPTGSLLTVVPAATVLDAHVGEGSYDGCESSLRETACDEHDFPGRCVSRRMEKHSFWDIHHRVVQRFGGILIGWRGWSDSGDTSELLAPPVNKDTPLPWSPADSLVIIDCMDADSIPPATT
eukprot:TRINITY_DN23255_c0_g1_i1.p1 TRINITY_DN23255_c0_g1~~TRINITY_DN23255_c0_g1_i1.p1  ORF type:complete len:713 (+),score=60.57 TRINITY_DN23255_c0_g1_i1:3-2141(+)